MQEKTQAGGYRPFGVSVLIAGYDEDGPHLTQIDPSGAYYNWKATAIGKNSKNAKIFLEKRYKADMEIEDAIHTALLTLKEGFEGEMNSNNIEVGVVREDKKFQVLTPQQIKEYLDELNWFVWIDKYQLSNNLKFQTIRPAVRRLAALR